MANTTPNFSSILDEAPTEVKFPKPLPNGTYLCTVMQPVTNTEDENAPIVRFPLKPIAAMDDVSEEDLTEAEGLEDKLLNVAFWANQIYALDRFHEHCGLDLSQPLSRTMRNEEIINSQVLAQVRQTFDKRDKTRVFSNVVATAKAD